ncbi:hypothetical protein U4E84_04105, partial [Halorubrum sp. AD140]|uniref:phage NrS-1 polymerase family protein n=1 Tax=Halorubrum sp. AD140 TaxID=3050073 RepID=UPI002ACC5AD4
MELPPTADALPEPLVERTQWVCWRTQQREDKQTKVPIIPGTTQFASTTDPDTWRSFQTAREAVTSTPVDGLGFVFSSDDPLIGVDLDDCRDPDTGEPTRWASQIISHLDSYTEVSPSGTGYHVLVTGTLPDGRNRSGDLEVYDRSRFFTVTGAHVAETPMEVAERTTAIASLHAEEVAATSTTNVSKTDPDQSSAEAPSRDTQRATGAETLADADLLKRAKNAANGAKFSRLWGGDTSGYESHSEADMALCRLLAFWTGCDHSRMDRLFRQSGLARDKWDDVHFADGSTYGEKTLERAIARTDDVYTPPETPTSVSTSSSQSDGPAAKNDTAPPAATADADATPQRSTADADSSTVNPPASPSDSDASAASSETDDPFAPSRGAHLQDETDPLAQIEDLTTRVEALI